MLPGIKWTKMNKRFMSEIPSNRICIFIVIAMFKKELRIFSLNVGSENVLVVRILIFVVYG